MSQGDNIGQYSEDVTGGIGSPIDVQYKIATIGGFEISISLVAVLVIAVLAVRLWWRGSPGHKKAQDDDVVVHLSPGMEVEINPGNIVKVFHKIIHVGVDDPHKR